jgi:Family of unknown function (DUF6522)
MSRIEIGLGALHINASVIAPRPRVQALMRKGEITSVCECAVNEDAGRYRLTRWREERIGFLAGGTIKESQGHCQ